MKFPKILPIILVSLLIHCNFVKAADDSLQVDNIQRRRALHSSATSSSSIASSMSLDSSSNSLSQPQTNSIFNAKNAGLLALGSLASTAVYKSGLLAKIKNHMQENKFITCVVTFAGAYGFYRQFCISKDVSGYIPKDDTEVISDDGKYHWIKIPGLKHLAVAGGPSHYIGRGESSELDELIEWESSLNLNSLEYYTGKTFKDLISGAKSVGEPYFLVRLAFYDAKHMVGYRCNDGQDVPIYQYRDANKYAKLRDCKASEIRYLQIVQIGGKYKVIVY